MTGSVLHFPETGGLSQFSLPSKTEFEKNLA